MIKCLMSVLLNMKRRNCINICLMVHVNINKPISFKKKTIINSNGYKS